jgi:dethiobiotin synthetase
MSAYFITATGTGVGKTFTSCALLHAAQKKNVAARAYKPIISGWSDDDTTDTAQIIAASGAPCTVEEVSPWRFAAPLSPHRAAALEGKTIDPEALIAWCKQRAQVADGLTIIEGAGGVLVPITPAFTMRDLMVALQLPVILIAGSYLGTISHTLTAIEALESRELSIHAVVISETEGSSVTLAEAVAGLVPLLGTIPLHIVQPRVSSPREATAIAALLDHLER